MDQQLARSTIDEKLAPVHMSVHALKCANKVIVNTKNPTEADLLEIWSLLSIVVDSIEFELEKSSVALAEYFKTWGA